MRRSKGHPWRPGSLSGSRAPGEAPAVAARVRWVGSGRVPQLCLRPAPSLGAGRTGLLFVTSRSAGPEVVDVAVVGSCWPPNLGTVSPCSSHSSSPARN